MQHGPFNSSDDEYEDNVSGPESYQNGDEEYDSNADADFEPQESSESDVLEYQSKDNSSDENLLERYENSVFKVYTHSKGYDFEFPWQPPTIMQWGGSGFVINYEGQVCLITNAHVADSASLMEIRLADEDKKYLATLKAIDHDCDLAMLEVADQSFWDKVEALELGNMPSMRSKLQVFGYPAGGQELCITDGQVSRIEVRPYAESGVSLLQAQVSAPINPGNSGGPAISNGKVLGVAFQGIHSLEGAGFIIPPPILEHFIKDALSHKQYRGFPNIAFESQHLNPPLKAYYGLDESQSGIRIQKINKLSSAYGILKKDDVLLEIDGHPIKDDGTVEMPFNKRIDYRHLIHTKELGDSIEAVVLRDKETMTLSIPLTHRANTTFYTSMVYDKPPSYYIHSGLVLCPLTDNHIDQGLADDFEAYADKPKKKAGQELVFIQTVLATEKTRDITSYAGSAIKEINGVKIKNLREAMGALEENTDDYHVIITIDKSKLVVPNLSKEENQAILKHYSIKKDRSKDLKGPPDYKPGCPEYEAFLPAFDSIRKSGDSLRNLVEVTQNQDHLLKPKTFTP